MKNKKLQTEKNNSNSFETVKIPNEVKKRRTDNLKIFNTVKLLVRNKPNLYTDNPTDVVKWAEKLVTLYKSLR